MSFLFRIHHLRKRYKNQEHDVLYNINLSFSSTGLVCIEGKSGCGKSTLLHLLLGMLSPNEGKIEFKGKDIQSFSARRMLYFRRFETSIVFQHYCLILHLKVIDNVMLPMLIAGISKAKAKRRAITLLKRFGLEGSLRKKARLLSGGEAQRVAICRSLSLNPLVIFADEPTGALDSDSAIKVMDMLKEISKNTLVIVVTHNHEIAEKYADRIIILSEGKVSSDTTIHRLFEPKGESKKRRIKNGIWKANFIAENLKKNRLSFFTRYLATFIGCTSILLCIGLASGISPALNRSKRNTLEYCSFLVSSKEYLETNSGPLRLVKQTRPEIEALNSYFEGFDDVSFHNDYSFFLPESIPFLLNQEKKEPARFIPIYDILLDEFGKDLLKEISFTDSKGYPCVVNEEFVSTYEAKVGDVISLDYPSEIIENSQKQSIFTKLDFFIYGVVSEFSFMNSPKAYYSYQDLEGYYGNYYLDELSFVNGKTQSLSTYVSGLSGNENYSSFAYRVYAHDIATSEALMEKIDVQEDEGIILESNPHEIASAFIALSDALVMASYLFMGIALISLVLILGFNAYSSFLSQKKQSAVLLALGAKKGDVVSIVSTEGIFISLLACIISLPISIFISEFISKILETRFGVDHMVAIPFASLWNIPFGLVFIVLALAILIPILASVIPLSFSGKIDLAEALKEE